MKDHSFMKKCIMLMICFVVVPCFTIGISTNAFSSEKTIVWNFSLWGGKRAHLNPIEKWAADMKKKTNGRWKINLHYGGTLAPGKENLNGLRAGMFEAANVAPTYAPGKTPLLTVTDLPFISPAKVKDIGKLLIELFKHPAIKKELLKWNAVPLLPGPLPPYNIMGAKPIKTVADFEGLRIRSGGEIGRLLKDFGAVPTMVSASEVYEAISRGTIDSVSFPFYAYGAYSVYEVSKYYNENLILGGITSTFLANKDAWDALPAEFKKYHLEWYANSPEIWAAEFKKSSDKWDPLFKKNLEFIDFPSTEVAKMRAKAEKIYEHWVKEREKEGLPGKEVLEYYFKKRKEICGY